MSAREDIIIVSRGKGKNVVLMSLDEFNALNETIYLTSTKTNWKRLDDAVEELEKGVLEPKN